MAAAERHLPTKKSPKGLGNGQVVESVVLLSALGGDCLDDFDNLRRDRGLAALLGYDLFFCTDLTASVGALTGNGLLMEGSWCVRHAQAAEMLRGRS
jgi:hypothetical protein